MTASALDRAFEYLQTRFAVEEIGRRNGMIVIQIGQLRDIAMAIMVNDPDIPTYDVLFPKLTQTPDGSMRLEAASQNRVELSTLELIASRLASIQSGDYESDDTM